MAIDEIKEYLSNSSVLVPFVPQKPFILYLTMHERLKGYILGQYDETRCKDQASYYSSKKFTKYKSRYSSLETICCALLGQTQKLK